MTAYRFVDLDTHVDVHIGIAIRVGQLVVKNDLKSKISAVFEVSELKFLC